MVLSGENKVLNMHQNIRNNSPAAIQNYGFAREFSEQYNYALRIKIPLTKCISWFIMG